MTIADRIALELAANAQSLRAPNGPTYYAAPRSVGVSVQSDIVRRLVDRGCSDGPRIGSALPSSRTRGAQRWEAMREPVVSRLRRYGFRRQAV